MAKFPKPFFKKTHGCWYVQIEGKQHRLSKEKDEAFELYHDLMRQVKKARRFQTPSAPRGPMTVGELWTKFRKLACKELASKTVGWYEEKVPPFLKHVGMEMPVEALQPLHMHEYISAHPQWNRGTVRNVTQAIKRVFNWGEKNKLIPLSPLHGLKKPAATRRTYVVKQEEYEELLEHIRSDAFRDVVRMCYLTGIRPQELKLMRVEHFDAPGARIILPPEEAKGHQWPRVIYLPSEALEIVQRRVQGNVGRDAAIFTNTRGKPWTTTALATEWGRLQQRLGAKELEAREESKVITEQEIEAKMKTLAPTRMVKGQVVTKSEKVLRSEAVRKLLKVKRREAGPKRLCLYNFRHTFATRSLQSGVDALTTAILLGHRDPSTLAKVYSHLTQSPEYLKAALKKSAGEKS